MDELIKAVTRYLNASADLIERTPAILAAAAAGSTIKSISVTVPDTEVEKKGEADPEAKSPAKKKAAKKDKKADDQNVGDIKKPAKALTEKQAEKEAFEVAKLVVKKFDRLKVKGMLDDCKSETITALKDHAARLEFINLGRGILGLEAVT